MSKRTASQISAAIILLIVLLGVYFVTSRAPEHKATPVPAPNNGGGKLAWELYFSPDGGCTEAIVDSLNEAKESVLVQAYSFTSSPIAEALVDAKKRGVNVHVILDKSNRTEKYSAADFLLHMGVPTFIDAEHAIAHNKVMIIDGETVITGSFNFTKAAEERNEENLLIIRDRALAERYTANWQAHKEHSEAFVE